MKAKKTPSGKYSGKIAITDKDGKRHYKRFTAATRKEAEAAAAEYLTRHRIYAESSAFAASLTRLLDDKRRILSPSTMAAYDSYARTLSQYEKFMQKNVDELARRDFQALADDLRRTRKRKTVSNIIGLVSEVLTHSRWLSV